MSYLLLNKVSNNSLTCVFVISRIMAPKVVPILIHRISKYVMCHGQRELKKQMEFTNREKKNSLKGARLEVRNVPAAVRGFSLSIWSEMKNWAFFQQTWNVCVSGVQGSESGTGPQGLSISGTDSCEGLHVSWSLSRKTPQNGTISVRLTGCVHSSPAGWR